MAKIAKILPEHINPNTELVPMRFLGIPDPADPEKRIGEAGLGLRVGETRGVPPEQAQVWLDKGLGEYDPPPAAAKKAKADA